MKKLYILLLFLIVIFQVNASVLAPDPNASITISKSINADTSNSTSITLANYIL